MDDLEVALTDIPVHTEWKQLGSGGFGEVFLVDHKHWGLCVLKRLRPDKIKRQGAEWEKVQKEALMLAHMRHPNIASIMGVICDPSEPGILMQHVHNGSLDTFIKKFLVPPVHKLRFVSEVILGMNYLHTKSSPIIHRDLKLANVLVTESYHCKIADFGLAEHKPHPDDDATYGLAGTPAYIAPEGLERRCCVPDEKFDVYAFGILIWELVVQGKAFAGEQMAILRPRVISGDRPSVAKFQQCITDHQEVSVLNDLMTQAWDSIPQNRPSFTDMNELIKNEMKKQPVIDCMAQAEIQPRPQLPPQGFQPTTCISPVMTTPPVNSARLQVLKPRDFPVEKPQDSLETKPMAILKLDQSLLAQPPAASSQSDPGTYGACGGGVPDMSHNSVTPVADLRTCSLNNSPCPVNTNMPHIISPTDSQANIAESYLASSAFQQPKLNSSHQVCGANIQVQNHGVTPNLFTAGGLRIDANQDTSLSRRSGSPNIDKGNQQGKPDQPVLIKYSNGTQSMTVGDHTQGGVVHVHRAQNVVLGNNVVVNIGSSSKSGPSSRQSASSSSASAEKPKTQLKVKKGIVDLPCLQTISSKLGKSCFDLGRALSLTDSDLDYIRADYASISAQEVAYQVLRQWREKSGPSATYSVLANGLLKARRADLAKLLSSNVS